MKKLLLALLLLASPAFGQSVQMSPPVTRLHVPYWVTSGVIGDGGSSADSPVSSIGVTNNGGAGICVSSDRQSAAGRNQLCFGAQTNGPATISLQNQGSAAPQALNFVINGVTTALPTSATPLPITSGGTGATTAAGAQTNLGLGTMATQNASAVAISGGTITGLPIPTNPPDAATKAYADGLASGLTIIAPSRLATAAVLPNTPTYSNGASGVGATLTAGSNTTLTVDSTVANLNDVVLVNNQAAPAQNGIYTVTTAGSGSAAWVLTRATYFNQASNMTAGKYTFISGGVANINTSWVLSATVTTVGTTAVVFNQFSSAVGVTNLGGLTGAITCGASLNCSAGTISNSTNGLTNSNLAQMPADTVKCNPTGSTANVQDCAKTVTLLPTYALSGGIIPANSVIWSQATVSGNITSTTGTPFGAAASTATITAQEFDTAGPTVNCGGGVSSGCAISQFDTVDIYHNFSVGNGVREGLNVTMVQSASTAGNVSTSGTYNSFYTGVFSAFNVQSSDGGTSAVNAKGNYEAIAGIVQTGSSATNLVGVIGSEYDVAMASGSGAIEKGGLQLISGVGGGVQTDFVHGTVNDFGLLIAGAVNGDVGFNIGIAFGKTGASWPIPSGGTIIGTYTSVNSMTATNGVDFSAVTFSGSAFKSPGFSVNASGDVKTSASFPSFTLNDTSATVTTGGLVRLTGNGNGTYSYQINTAVAGDFSSVSTPLTILSTGVIQLPIVAGGTPVASLCIDASNNVIKKTTTGSCI